MRWKSCSPRIGCTGPRWAVLPDGSLRVAGPWTARRRMSGSFRSPWSASPGQPSPTRRTSCSMYSVKMKDHSGKRYGRLLVSQSLDERDSKGQVVWDCTCDCGSKVKVSGGDLRSRRSCGCAKGGTTHGLAGRHPLYTTWTLIRQRVDNPTCPYYRLYGGRGISYTPRWNDFLLFLNDVGERPPNPEGYTSRKPYWSIDRIDPDGNYEPGNIRWATQAEQNRNKSKVRVP